MMDGATEASLLEPGRNCWRLERAELVGLIVYAAEDSAQLRQALRAARGSEGGAPGAASPGGP